MRNAETFVDAWLSKWRGLIPAEAATELSEAAATFDNGQGWVMDEMNESANRWG